METVMDCAFKFISTGSCTLASACIFVFAYSMHQYAFPLYIDQEKFVNSSQSIANACRHNNVSLRQIMSLMPRCVLSRVYRCFILEDGPCRSSLQKERQILCFQLQAGVSKLVEHIFHSSIITHLDNNDVQYWLTLSMDFDGREQMKF